MAHSPGGLVDLPLRGPDGVGLGVLEDGAAQGGRLAAVGQLGVAASGAVVSHGPQEGGAGGFQLLDLPLQGLPADDGVGIALTEVHNRRGGGAAVQGHAPAELPLGGPHQVPGAAGAAVEQGLRIGVGVGVTPVGGGLGLVGPVDVGAVALEVLLRHDPLQHAHGLLGGRRLLLSAGGLAAAVVVELYRLGQLPGGFAVQGDALLRQTPGVVQALDHLQKALAFPFPLGGALVGEAVLHGLDGGPEKDGVLGGLGGAAVIAAEHGVVLTLDLPHADDHLRALAAPGQPQGVGVPTQPPEAGLPAHPLGQSVQHPPVGGGVGVVAHEDRGRHDPGHLGLAQGGDALQPPDILPPAFPGQDGVCPEGLRGDALCFLCHIVSLPLRHRPGQPARADACLTLVR